MLETKNLRLLPHVPAHLIALTESEEAYETCSGIRIAPGVRDFLLAGSADFMARLRGAIESDPWSFGFAVMHKIDNRMIGFGSFTGPPTSEGEVEIAYGIAPEYQRKGYATEVAARLVDFAGGNERVKIICAHTLPETNASTRVLEKCGFQKTGEVVDSENNLVWRWEHPATSTS